MERGGYMYLPKWRARARRGSRCRPSAPRGTQLHRFEKKILLVVGVALVLGPDGAFAFGTVRFDGGVITGQSGEHEWITRRAFRDTVMGPQTLGLIAGHLFEWGAVGAPDLYEFNTEEAHCDNG